MSDLDSLDDSLTTETLTSEQQSKLNQVVEICSDETVENCRKTLERNDWEVDRSVMELLSPVDQVPIPDEPEVVRPPVNRPIPTQTSAPNLRRRNVTNLQHNTRRTFAQVAANRQPRTPGRLRTLVSKIINTAMKILQYVFNVPGYIISSVPGLSWLQAATNTKAIIPAGLSRKEQVKKSIEIIKSSCPELGDIDFIEGSYNDALTRSKKEVRYLICYVHLDEHEDTKLFLEKIGGELKEFLRQNDALFWGCSFDCPEGTLAVSELMITKYPCLSLLAPKNAAHVSVISRIESPHIAELKNSVQNYEGEMVVLKAEKQARDQETRLRQTQEADYQKTLQADQLRMQQKIEEERISKEKEQEKHEKAVALALAKDTAEKILQEVDQMDKDDIFKIRVKMPSGLQLQQEFSSLASIRHVRALVLVQDEIKNNQFSLTSQFPTKVYLNEEESLASAFGANKNQILFIKLNSEEESEDTSSESE